MHTRMIFPLLLGALALGAPPAHAQAAAPAESKTAAESQTIPPGCPGGWGPGYGMGPGMMGGGYGMGPGMMGGYGMGLRGVPDLTADQRAKLVKIRDETRRKHWTLMGQLMDEQAKLGDLYDAPKQDSEAISASYKKVSELQRRMYEYAADAHKRMEAVLTKEQQEKWWRFWRR